MPTAPLADVFNLLHAMQSAQLERVVAASTFPPCEHEGCCAGSVGGCGENRLVRTSLVGKAPSVFMLQLAPEQAAEQAAVAATWAAIPLEVDLGARHPWCLDVPWQMLTRQEACSLLETKVRERSRASASPSLRRDTCRHAAHQPCIRSS